MSANLRLVSPPGPVSEKEGLKKIDVCGIDHSTKSKNNALFHALSSVRQICYRVTTQPLSAGKVLFNIL